MLLWATAREQHLLQGKHVQGYARPVHVHIPVNNDYIACQLETNRRIPGGLRPCTCSLARATSNLRTFEFGTQCFFMNCEVNIYRQRFI